MNSFKLKKILTEMVAPNNPSDIIDGKVIFDSSIDWIEVQYAMRNGSDIELDRGWVKFDGTANDGLMWSRHPRQSSYIINANSSSYMMEFDFSIEEPSNDTVNGIQCMFIEMENSTTIKLNCALYIVPEKKWISMCFFNTSNGGYSAWNGFHVFDMGVDYNFKFLVLSNNEFGMYINDKLICRGNTKTRGDRGSGNIQAIQSATHFLGMQAINGSSINMKGRINNFRIIQIDSTDDVIFDTSKYAKNKLVYIPFDYRRISTVGHIYNDNHIKNLGNYSIAIGYKSNSSYEGQYYTNETLGGSFMSWFMVSSSHHINLSSQVFNDLGKWSVSVRIRTTDDITSCVLIDTRSTTDVYDGWVVTQPSADPTSLILYISNKNATYNSSSEWFDAISSPNGIIQPNSHYMVTVMWDGGYLSLYVDGELVAKSESGNITPNINGAYINFGNDHNGSYGFNGYMRDITIYDDCIIPQDDIYENTLTYDATNEVSSIINDPKFITEQKNRYKPIAIMSNEDDLNRLYREYNNFRKLYFYVEGVDDTRTLKLQKDGRTYFNATDILEYDYASNQQQWIIYIVEEDRYVPVINLSRDRGLIKGNIYISRCEGSDMNEMFIRCFASNDHRYIGEFPIINNGYLIPNLDANQEYDIVLVDKSKTIEQKILSHRKPEPYENT